MGFNKSVQFGTSRNFVGKIVFEQMGPINKAIAQHNVSPQAHEDIRAAINALNFVQWKETLPATGESKYIYAVPREETDTDGKQIAALYLWDGTRWNGAGAFSLNIDPATLATKTDLTNYLPLTGGRVTGQLIVDNNTIAKAVYVKDPALAGTWYRALRNNGSSGNIIVGQYDGIVGTEIQTPKNTITANIKGTSTNILTALDKSVANGVASLDKNAKVPSEQIPVATASTLGGVKVEFDETTGTLNIKTE